MNSRVLLEYKMSYRFANRPSYDEAGVALANLTCLTSVLGRPHAIPQDAHAVAVDNEANRFGGP
jgi:hypothetical protein